MQNIKGISIFLALAAIFVLCTACVGTPVVWDSSLNEDQMTTVSWGNIKPVSYNGIAVEKWRTVKIPAGNAAVICDVYDRSYSAKNKEFDYRFEPGVWYFVLFGMEEGYWGVQIYDRYNKKETLDFVRFK